MNEIKNTLKWFRVTDIKIEDKRRRGKKKTEKKLGRNKLQI